MVSKVKTPYFSSFNIPKSCVACGGTPGVDTTWKVSGSKSSWSGKQTTTMSLEFPLCDQCYAVSRNASLARVVSVVGIVIGFGFCLVMAGLVGSGAFDNAAVGVGIGVTLFLGLAVLVRWMTNWINQRDLTPEQRERRRLVQRSAKITGFKAPGLIFDKQGWVLFSFENASFAAQFSGMNSGAAA